MTSLKAFGQEGRGGRPTHGSFMYIFFDNSLDEMDYDKQLARLILEPWADSLTASAVNLVL